MTPATRSVTRACKTGGHDWCTNNGAKIRIEHCPGCTCPDPGRYIPCECKCHEPEVLAS